LFIIIPTVLIILGIIHLVGLISGSSGKKPHGESPLHILEGRYAMGGITLKEYEKMRDELKKD
jgi:uncharacterized membrane protein